MRKLDNELRHTGLVKCCGQTARTGVVFEEKSTNRCCKEIRRIFGRSKCSSLLTAYLKSVFHVARIAFAHQLFPCATEAIQKMRQHLGRKVIGQVGQELLNVPVDSV